MRLVAYASANEEELEDQLDEIKDHCIGSGDEIIETYSDDSQDSKAGLLKAWTRCQKNDIHGLIVYSYEVSLGKFQTDKEQNEYLLPFARLFPKPKELINIEDDFSLEELRKLWQSAHAVVIGKEVKKKKN